MRAKEAAKHTKAKDKIQDTIVKPGAGAGAVGAQVGSADIERPAVPVAKPESKNEEMEEIPIAGRTKMTVPKAKGVQDSSLNEAEAADEESTEQLDAKSELNSILKRAPGMICAVLPYLRLVCYES